MNISGQAVMLRVFVGEGDKLGHQPLYEVIVRQARDADLAGATVIKSVLSFGATARIRSQKILDLSADLSMVIEIIDEEEKILKFKSELTDLFERAGCGGLVTQENIRITQYCPKKES